MPTENTIIPGGKAVETPSSSSEEDDCSDLARYLSTCCQHSPSSGEKCPTLQDKAVNVVGLIQRSTCCCDTCKACGKCRLPDAYRDVILRKFNETIVADRLERLGTYAQDFGDTKIQKKGDNSVYIRSVRVRGDTFSVAYKLTLAQTSPSNEIRPRLSPSVEDPRLLRQKSQG